MAIKRGQLANQQFGEQWGRIIGLMGDPANQDGASNTGYTMTEAFGLFTADTTSNTFARTLFWSRLLLCEILQPNDINGVFSRFALVLRPRSCWLFDHNGSDVKDFMGNIASAANLISSPSSSPLTEISPTYYEGDYIRIGTLPAPITINGWHEGFYISTKISEEFPDGTFEIRDKSLTFPTCKIPNPYNTNSNITFSQVIYYDKNADARGRFSPTNDGASVDINVCIGGVIHTYRLRGTQLT